MTEPSAAERLFFAAIDLATPTDQSAYLDKACGADQELRQNVEKMLQAHRDMGSFMEHGPAVQSSGADPASPNGESDFQIPDKVHTGSLIAGRYELVEQIGRGGMGCVWRASQVEPIQRQVAVKLLLPGMDSKRMLACFESERQALALMNHPNIARVFDAGETTDGSPFIVMELVDGTSITRYCDERKLPVTERLRLFICVCQAIQHAHQKGVIHRDIKPSNVLVASCDGQAVPKVIDFGVSKAARESLSEASLLHDYGLVVGSLQYMSPEQAQADQRAVDTRSDIYTLGALLHELLTGMTPLSRQELENIGLFEILRIIRELEPRRPSTRLRGSPALPEIALARASQPELLAGMLQGDLDWIVMKALENERSRRYDSAIGFSADIQRYLDGEPVEAHPPSVSYRLRKLGRKHRLALSAGVGFLALLLFTVVMSSWMAWKTGRANLIAEEKRIQAEEQSQRADDNATLVMKGLIASECSRRIAQTSAASLQIDLDLAEFQVNPRVALLRLASQLRKIPDDRAGIPVVVPAGMRVAHGASDSGLVEADAGGSAKSGSYKVNAPGDLLDEQRNLREFVSTAILAMGRDYAPVLAPAAMGKRGPVRHYSMNRSGDRFLTLHSTGEAHLWDAMKMEPIARLQRDSEKVDEAKFSEDGALIATTCANRELRIWRAHDGAFVSRICPKKNSEPIAGVKEYMQTGVEISFSKDRILTSYWVSESLPPKSNARPIQRDDEGKLVMGSSIIIHPTVMRFNGPSELWDAVAGKLISKIPERNGNTYIWGEGKWIVGWGKKDSIAVYSAKDGAVRAHIGPPSGVPVGDFMMGSTGRRLVVRNNVKSSADPQFRVWDCETWKELIPPAPGLAATGFFADDLVQIHERDRFKLVALSRERAPRLLKTDEKRFTRPEHPRVRDNFIMASDGQLYDWVNDRPLLPPPGKKYHPELQRFAADGRFVMIEEERRFIDSKTEKSFPARSLQHSIHEPFLSFDERVGWTGFAHSIIGDVPYPPTLIHFFRIPPISRQQFLHELVELWVQLAVRGELAQEGTFLKWDEAAWEKQRQKLAKMAIPDPYFPFPGFLAQDRLHWLRSEFQTASNAEKPAIAKRLLERCTAEGNTDEAEQWNRWLAAPGHRPQN